MFVITKSLVRSIARLVYLNNIVIYEYYYVFRVASKTNVRQSGVEPGAQAWDACMLPLHYWRSCIAYPFSARNHPALAHGNAAVVGL